MKDEENIDELAEELTQKYFQRFCTFTCSWENVKEILKERIEIEQSLKEQNKNLRCCGNCNNSFFTTHRCMKRAKNFECINFDKWEMRE